MIQIFNAFKNDMHKTILLLCLSFLFPRLYSQKEANNWPMGGYQLDFSNGNPIVKFEFAEYLNRGCGAISDKNGAVILYTDGFSVWNKYHQQMPNGNSLIPIPTVTSTQESIVVPKPGTGDHFYIFTVDPWNGQSTSGLYYAEVDLTLHGGSGDVISKGTRLLDSTTSRLSATMHSNGRDIWLLTHIHGTDRYCAFRISDTGISAPVESRIGHEHHYWDGQMKFSPDGKLVVASYEFEYTDTTFSDLFDFSNETGQLSHSRSLQPVYPYYNGGGCEFSPDSKKLYIEQEGIGLYQFDLTDPSKTAINASKQIIYREMYNTFRQMQLAPDGNIYITKGGGGGGTEHLGIISNTNEKWDKVHVEENGLYLKGGSSFVNFTPNFIQNYFYNPGFATSNPCQNAVTHFELTNDHLVDSVKWNFGDGHISRSIITDHVYDAAGTYHVNVVAFHHNGTETISKEIVVHPEPMLELGNDKTVCSGYELRLDDIYSSYVWNTGDTLYYTSVDSAAVYKVKVKNVFGCSAMDSIHVSINELPALNIADTISVNENDSVLIEPGSFDRYLWSTGDTASSLYISEEGWYGVKVANQYGCENDKSFYVAVGKDTGPGNEGNWTLLNPLPSAFAGTDICFISRNAGFILTGKEILRTNDGGNSWTVQMKFPSATRFAFKNSIGYIIGNNGAVYKSTLNGGGWNKLSTGFGENLNSITIIDTDTLFITGDTKLFKSYDGGESWQTLYVPDIDIQDAFFTGSLVGHVAGKSGKIMKTVDGGQSWYTTESVNYFPSDYLRIYFVDENTGFASREHNDIFKTTDGGESWSEIQNTSDAIYDFFFLDEQNGFIAGEYGVLFKTANGGTSWDYCGFLNGRYGNADMKSIYFIDQYTGFAVGNRGVIMKTANGGKSWDQYAPTYNNINQIDFINGSIGYCLGDKVFKTADYGNTWDTLGTGLADYSYYHFYYKTGHFFNQDTFLVVADNYYYSELLKSTDGGITFQTVRSSWSNSQISSMYFLNERTGFLCVYGGIYKSVDGGSNWTSISTQNLSDIGFFSDKAGIGVQYGDLYKTTDGGINWVKDYEIYGDLNQIQILNDSVAFIAGEFNTVLKTTDSGNTWEELKTEYDHLTAVCFYNENVGYVSGEYGSIYKTMNGGYSWEREGINALINSITIDDSKNIYVAGANGIIYRNYVDYDPVNITLNPVENISDDYAMASGRIASNSDQIDTIYFEYGLTGTFDHRINAIPDHIGADKSELVAAGLIDLAADKVYSCRLKIVYKGIEYCTDYKTFRTLPEIELTMYSPYGYSSDEMDVSGLIISHEDSITNIEFQYGPDMLFMYSAIAAPGTVYNGDHTNCYSPVEITSSGDTILCTPESRI